MAFVFTFAGGRSRLKVSFAGLMLAGVVIMGASALHGEQGQSCQVLTYRGINVFEGSVALVFADNSGRTVMFSQIDEDAEMPPMYTKSHIEGSFFPEMKAVESMVGRKFRVFYRMESRMSDFSGEYHTMKVVYKIVPLN